jgi:L,D-transpeptidase ErfK/SrfK
MASLSRKSEFVAQRRIRLLQVGHCPNVRFQWLIAILMLLLPMYSSRADEAPRLSNAIVGREFQYIVLRGDSLTSVGARFGVAVSTLAATNGLSSSAFLKEGQKLQIDNRHIVPAFLANGIVINIPQRMFFYFNQHDGIRAFPVALGRPDWPTPVGPFTIVGKRENPEWNVPESIQEEMLREEKTVTGCVPPGPDNPLGTHWFRLSIPGYGIHGTIAPASIYHFLTHGCIRMNPDDIAAIFPEVMPGTPGRILYQRLLIAKVGARVFLEVHRDIYGKQPTPLPRLLEILRTHDLGSSLDWEKVKLLIEKQEGVAREVTKNAPEHR